MDFVTQIAVRRLFVCGKIDENTFDSHENVSKEFRRVRNLRRAVLAVAPPEFDVYDKKTTHLVRVTAEARASGQCPFLY